jgi:Zn-dependent protease
VGDVLDFLQLLPPLLFALTIHEFSHGYAAFRLGDPTARLMGRLTLNPLAHLDPIGSILFLLPPHFGWAKPVPVNPRNLRHPRRDMMWVALAGPASNVVLAAIFGTLLRLQPYLPFEFTSPASVSIVRMAETSVVLNLVLAFFNMIPIFPLDGSRILIGILPADLAERYRALEPAGPMILLGLILLGAVSGVRIIQILIFPFVNFFALLFTGGLR